MIFSRLPAIIAEFKPITTFFCVPESLILVVYQRQPLKIAFVARTSEIVSDKAEAKNRRRRGLSHVEDGFSTTTPSGPIAAVRSKNEFLEIALLQLRIGKFEFGYQGSDGRKNRKNKHPPSHIQTYRPGSLRPMAPQKC